VSVSVSVSVFIFIMELSNETRFVLFRMCAVYGIRRRPLTVARVRILGQFEFLGV
jgi:hypothetical protein